jgi:hypothetical protein
MPDSLDEVIDICVKDGGVYIQGRATKGNETEEMLAHNLVLHRPDNRSYGYWMYNKASAKRKIAARLRAKNPRRKATKPRPGVPIDVIKPLGCELALAIRSMVEGITDGQVYPYTYNKVYRPYGRNGMIQQVMTCAAAYDKIRQKGVPFARTRLCARLLNTLEPYLDRLDAVKTKRNAKYEKDDGNPVPYEHRLAKLVRKLRAERSRPTNNIERKKKA